MLYKDMDLQERARKCIRTGELFLAVDQSWQKAHCFCKSDISREKKKKLFVTHRVPFTLKTEDQKTDQKKIFLKKINFFIASAECQWYSQYIKVALTQLKRV